VLAGLAGGHAGGTVGGGATYDEPTLSCGMLVDCEVTQVNEYGARVVLNGSGLKGEIRNEHIAADGSQVGGGGGGGGYDDRQDAPGADAHVSVGQVIECAVLSLEPENFRLKVHRNLRDRMPRPLPTDDR
jgi:hypothetical protein